MVRIGRTAAISGVLIFCGAVWAINDPVAHWKFDEGSGDTAYDSEGTNHGTLVNGPVWAEGKIGGALAFDGADDHVRIPDSVVLDFAGGDFSMVLWFKTNGPSNAWQEQFMVNFRQNDNSPHIEIYTAAGRLGTHLLPYEARITDGYAEDNKWHHAAITLDNGSSNGYKLYLDGVRVGQRTYSGTLSNWDTLKLGGDFQGPGTGRPEYFRGLLDEVIIYGRALSAEEIEELYHGQLLELEILGPNEVAEDFEARYRAVAHYERLDVDVTDSVVWSVAPNDIASIDAGVLVTEEIGAFTEDVTIDAQYTGGEVAVNASKPVTVFAVCAAGNALQFDGTNDYVNCGYDPSLNVSNQITIQAWIYPQANRWMGIVSKGDDVARHDDYGLWFGSGKVELSFNWPERWGIYPAGDRFVGDMAVSLNQWSHFVGTWDGSAVRLYVNGQLDKEFPWTYGINSSGAELYFGVNPGGGDEYFKGIMDEVVILDRALSAEEIRAAMHTKLTGAEPNLVGYWDFDEGIGQIAHDLTANGNNGRLSSSSNPDSRDPVWVASDAPVGACPIPCVVDIKPGSCPNPVNVNSRGVVPVAILGSEDFDVTEVDPASIELAGVGAIRSSFEDVSAPVVDGNECECTEAWPDGFTDLTLKFDTQEIVHTLGEVNHGDVLQLALTGVLADGTTIEGADCIVVRGKFKPFNQGDVNKDGIVNVLDFAAMAEDWLESTVAVEQ